MGRKNKAQKTVEDFEITFKNVAQEYFADINIDKVEKYFSDPALYAAVCNKMNEEQE